MSHSENRARHDLAVVGLLTAGFALLSVILDLSESLFRWTHAGESLQLDEIPQIVLVFAALLAWFAWRRMRELKAELTRRRQVEARLAAALAENRRLGRQAIEVQESERRALAREMHDELGQYLVAIRLDATAIREDVGSDRERVSNAATSIVHHVDHVQAVVRDIIGRLRPAGLDELGLPAALENCIEDWRRRLPGAEIELLTQGDLEELGEDISLALYRLAQECLTNASRHAAATRVQVALTGDRDANGCRTISFCAEDDGCGTTMPPNGNGFGLAGMRERVQSIGGEFLLDSSPGAGFRVRATIRRPPDRLASEAETDVA
jgi:two-component system sensor histidine kinase UhpB